MIGIGEILWDILPEGRQLGGAPANFAFHCQQLGNQGIVISCVGDDDLGSEIKKSLQELGVSSIVGVTPQYSTGTVMVEMASRGIPTYTIAEDVAWDHLSAETHHLEMAAQANVICFGSLASRSESSAQTIDNILSNCTKGCIRIFDINLRQHYYNPVVVKRLLSHSNVFKLNQEELIIVSEMLGYNGTEDQLLEILCETFALKLIILTKGEMGSRLFSPVMGNSVMGVMPVEIVDTVGAGDAFTAAVATGLVHGLPLQKIHSLATRVAGYVCNKRGATPTLPLEYKLAGD